MKHPILQGCRIYSNWGKYNGISLGLILLDSSRTLFCIALTYMYIKHKAISDRLLEVIMKHCILVFTLKDVSKNPFYLESEQSSLPYFSAKITDRIFSIKS